MPSPFPTPKPTPTPTKAPLPEPTPAPTISTLNIDFLLDGVALGDIVPAGNTSVLTFEAAYTGEMLKISGYVTLRLCEGSASHTYYHGPAEDRPYESCEDVDTVLHSYEFDETMTYSFYPDGGALEEIGSSQPYYFRVDSIASRDSGDYETQSAYTLAHETANFYFVGGYPTPEPSFAPTIPPTYPPTLTPVFAPTAAPVVPPTAAPAPAPTAAPTVHVPEDSLLWYKTDEPSKDCSWVAAYMDADGVLVRCDVKGWDGTYATESCAVTCADYE